MGSLIGPAAAMQCTRLMTWRMDDPTGRMQMEQVSLEQEKQADLKSGLHLEIYSRSWGTPARGVQICTGFGPDRTFYGIIDQIQGLGHKFFVQFRLTFDGNEAHCELRRGV
jgi:hypothetical protein